MTLEEEFRTIPKGYTTTTLGHWLNAWSHQALGQEILKRDVYRLRISTLRHLVAYIKKEAYKGGSTDYVKHMEELFERRTMYYLYRGTKAIKGKGQC